MRLRRTPLAWRNLTHDARRLCVAVGGICFAVLLMFMQRGFQNALFDSQVKLIDDLDDEAAQLFMISTARYAIPVPKRFPRERLLQARAEPQVEEVFPIYIETRLARLKMPGRSARAVRVIGVELPSPLFASGSVNRYASQLNRPDTAVIDAKSKPNVFPFDYSHPDALERAAVELQDRAVRLVGAFALGADFATDGSLLMSEKNFAAYFPSRAGGRDPLSVVDIAAVRLRPGADPDQTMHRLRRLLPSDIRVFTRRQFRNREIDFWDNSTPVGIVFSLGTSLGFVVGMIICYQIIYADIADHMPELATLKAMGYGRSYFVRLIVAESLYLSLLGFLPGVLLSWAAFTLAARRTGLLMNMTPWPRILLVLALTVIMCVSSGLLALRRLARADPADLF